MEESLPWRDLPSDGGSDYETSNLKIGLFAKDLALSGRPAAGRRASAAVRRSAAASWRRLENDDKLIKQLDYADSF